MRSDCLVQFSILNPFLEPMNCFFVHASSIFEFGAMRSDFLVQFSIFNPAFQIQINISHLKGDIYLLRIQINQNNELHVKECFEPSIKALVRNMIPELLQLDLVNGTPLNTSLPSKSIKKLLCISLRLLVQPYNQIQLYDILRIQKLYIYIPII